MVVTSRYFAFRALITQPRIWKGFWVENSTSVLYLPIPSSAETWKIFTKHFSRDWENSWQLCKTFSVIGGQTHEVNRLILWLVFHNTCSHKAKVWIVWSWPFYQPILINFALSAATTFSLASLAIWRQARGVTALAITPFFSFTSGDIGSFLFCAKSRKFGFEIKWNAPFWLGPTGVFGTPFERGPQRWSIGSKCPYPFDKIVAPRAALLQITKRAVAWVGSVQPDCTVPLGTWNFRNFKPDFFLNRMLPQCL